MAARSPLTQVSGRITELPATDALAIPELSGSLPTPAAGLLAVGAKSDHKVYLRDSSGNETLLGGSTQRTFAYWLS